MNNNFYEKKIDGKKWEGRQWRIQREGFGRAEFQRFAPISEKYSDFTWFRLNKK